ncbi:MAG: methionine adenosyltransferase [Planctomycetes bacterium]|nr:methionine adenosyltransferase [Planctomycetota bacterium]
MSDRHLFTSECVSMGHPDKVADQISDAMVDGFLAQDPDARVAIETLVTTNTVVLAGEVRAKPGVVVHYEKVARRTIAEIGYNDPALLFDAASCNVHILVHAQSADIAQGVDQASGELGAGDQGLMFGYACDDTPERMPLPISLARRIIDQLVKLRESKQLPWLRPDAKSQVTVEFDGAKAVRVHTVVVSTQHAPKISQKAIREAVIEQVVKPVMPEGLIDKKTVWHVNPTGKFEIGGPHGDSGLTGRKIIVDTYGGWGRHGGGAFSGKDPSKVDRSAAYTARYVARNLVDAGLARRCEVQLAYAIGVAEPLSIRVDTFGTGAVADTKLAEVVREVFDLTPAGMIKSLKLRRPVYLATARHGHFGRTGPGYTWEASDRAAALRRAVS